MPASLRRQSLSPLIRGTGDGWLFLLLVLFLLLFPLARGGNRLWVVSVFETAVFALAFLWFLQYLRGRVVIPEPIPRAWPIILLWLCWLAYIAIQITPLPLDALGTLAPRSVDIHRAASEFAGTGLHSAPLSAAPAETRDHLLESACYFTLFMLVLLMVRSSSRLRFMAMAIVVGGLLQALYGTLFLLSGAETGLFMDQASRLNVATGTFVNRNHLAGYLEITGAVGIGLVLSGLTGGGARTWRARFRHLIEILMSDTVRIRVFVALMVVALVLTRSRMGNVAFVTSIGLAGLIYVLLRERRLFFKSLIVFATLFLIDLWILGNWFGLEKVVERLEQTDASTEMRVTVFPDLVTMAQAYWPLGSGLGSFYTAFPEFRSEAVDKLHYHAHHDYLQFLIETGAIGVSLLGGIVALVFFHALRLLRRRKDRLVGGIAFAAIMAIIAIGIHSTVDFNLQIPANAATLIVVMAMAVSCSPISRSRRRVSHDIPFDENVGGDETAACDVTDAGSSKHPDNHYKESQP